jgi:hypothetical protein
MAWRSARLPLVARWIEDPAQTPAVLIGYLSCWRGAMPDGLRKHRVRITATRSVSVTREYP